MNKKNLTQSGSATVVIVVIIAVALVGALGFIFWQNTIGKASMPNEVQTTTAEGTDTDFLTIGDWGIKFKLPQTQSKITYHRVDAEGGVYYGFSTKRVEALDDACADPVGHDATWLSSLTRFTSKQTNAVDMIVINNEEPIAGYYYYLVGSRSACSTSGAEIQSEDMMIIDTMLGSPISI
jgi:hypothetical protein